MKRHFPQLIFDLEAPQKGNFSGCKKYIFVAKTGGLLYDKSVCPHVIRRGFEAAFEFGHKSQKIMRILVRHDEGTVSRDG